MARATLILEDDPTAPCKLRATIFMEPNGGPMSSNDRHMMTLAQKMLMEAFDHIDRDTDIGLDFRPVSFTVLC